MKYYFTELLLVLQFAYSTDIINVRRTGLQTKYYNK